MCAPSLATSGMRVGVGGHLTALRRTAVGPYDLAGARTLDSWRSTSRFARSLTPLEPSSPPRELTADEVQALRFGTRLHRSGAPGPVAAFDPTARW
jgi:tRNA pseudouridine55 synthase